MDAVPLVSSSPSPQYRTRLRTQLVASFDASEFKVLCADIGVNHDTVPGDELESRAHGLILKLARRNELTRLTDYCAKLRPNLGWQELAEEREQTGNLAGLDGVEMPPPPKPDQPPQPTTFIGREQAFEHYTLQLTEHHFALICGFAGVGKTTLAAALARRMYAPETIFWHSFHADEGVEVILWKLAGFLAWHGQTELWRMLQSARQGNGPAQPPQVLLDYLMPALSGRDVVLCLDDYHWVMDDPLMAQMVQRLHGALGASALSLIITSREMPAFAETAQAAPLPGLSLTDVQAWLAQRKLALSATLAQELHAYTEGNAQFLTLAMNALEHAPSPERFISRLAEATDIERYLLREIDRDLSDDERAAMGAVAVLLGYPATRDALDAVLNGNLARRTLNALSERFLLTVNEGATGKEFSQHAIVRAFYYDQLSKRERQAMHVRAGEFYAHEEADALKAALHFEQAGDVPSAAHWATMQLHTLINQGQARPLQKLLERLPTQALDAVSRAQVDEARGDIQFLFGEFDDALRDYASAAQHLGVGDALALAQLQRKQGEVLYRQSAFEQSLAAFTRGRELLAEHADATLEGGQLAVGYGSTLLALGRYDDALTEAWRGLLQLPDAPPQPSIGASIEANLCDLIGKVAFYKGDFGESLNQFETALNLRQGIADLRGVVKSYSNVAVVYGQQNRYDEAMKANQSALEIAERIGDTVALGMLYNNVASDFAERGEYDKALEFHQRSLGLSEKLGDLVGVSQSYLNIGDIHRRTEKFDDALSYFSRAIELANQVGSDDEFIFSTISRAATYFAQRRFEEALQEAMSALDRARQVKNLYARSQCLDLLGRILHSTQKWSEGRTCFEEATQLEREQATNADLAQTLLHWANLERDAGQVDRAETLWSEAIAIAKTHQLDDVLAQAIQFQ